jgi:hypothetical protein
MGHPLDIAKEAHKAAVGSEASDRPSKALPHHNVLQVMNRDMRRKGTKCKNE